MVKDLRGPAVAELMSPTNLLIRSGFVGVFGCILLFLLLAIPALLPVTEDEQTTRAALPMMKIDKGLAKNNPTEQQSGGPPMAGGGGGPPPPGGPPPAGPRPGPRPC